MGTLGRLRCEPHVAFCNAFLLALAACAHAPAAAGPTRVTISVVGTSDLHGHVLPEGGRGGLAVLSGYLKNLRRVRAHDGGAVLLVDAGDAFQGTLESNLNEGAAVIQAMNALGYNAMTIGNHEFDYGPDGPKATPTAPGDDPRGAIKARAAEARFPLLAANLSEGGKRVAWKNVRATTWVTLAGVKIGIIGVTTEETPFTTMAINFKGLDVRPLADTIAGQAADLRAGGARLVVVAAHAGGSCSNLADPADVASCDKGEIFKVAEKLPRGSVDVIVAGHTHAGIAHVVNGIAIIESFSYGAAFGRVDLTVDRAAGTVVAHVFPPRELCEAVDDKDRCDPAKKDAARTPASYEGEPVVADAAVAKILAPFVAAARARGDEKLGVHLDTMVRRVYDVESPLGNLFVDLMREARPDADVVINNGGSLRADLPAGDLTYARLFEAFPFDNRFATVRVTGVKLRAILAANLQTGSGVFSLSGARLRARCEAGGLQVTLTRPDGRPIGDEEELTLVTSDFVATGSLSSPRWQLTPRLDDVLVREGMVQALKKRGGRLSGEDKTIFDPANRRLDYPGTRPVHCQ